MLTTIQLDKETRESLKKHGMKDETYDEIVRRLVEIADRQAFYGKQKRILKGERFVSLEDV